MPDHDEPLRFRFDEIRNAPTTAGLYAWYGRLHWGHGDVDTVGATRMALSLHTRRFVTPELVLQAATTFSRTWSGALAETTSRSFDDALGIQGGDPAPFAPGEDVKMAKQRRLALTKAVKRVTEVPALRSTLLETINRATPLIASPVYVGISNNLRQRLISHTGLFDDYAASATTPEERRDLMRNDDSFAARAVGSGLTAEMLEVFCFPVEVDDVADRRAMIEAVEYFLNRWHQPAFGRR